MTTLDSLLLGILAALVIFKFVLLAAAAVLFAHMLTQRLRQRTRAHSPVPARHRRLDVRA
jgi:hypothetical protein